VKLHRFLIVPAAALIMVLAGSCTSSPGSAGKSSTLAGPAARTDSVAEDVQVIKIQGTDALRFSPSSLVLKPGRVRVVFTVAGKKPQTFTSRVLGADSGIVSAGETVTVDLEIPKPGKYPFYSAFHEKQGMKGVLLARG
jgi:plastocyanin